MIADPYVELKPTLSVGLESLGPPQVCDSPSVGELGSAAELGLQPRVANPCPADSSQASRPHSQLLIWEDWVLCGLRGLGVRVGLWAPQVIFM